jgi:hypothetical protein
MPGRTVCLCTLMLAFSTTRTFSGEHGEPSYKIQCEPAELAVMQVFLHDRNDRKSCRALAMGLTPRYNHTNSSSFNSSSPDSEPQTIFFRVSTKITFHGWRRPSRQAVEERLLFLCRGASFPIPHRSSRRAKVSFPLPVRSKFEHSSNCQQALHATFFTRTCTCLHAWLHLMMTFNRTDRITGAWESWKRALLCQVNHKTFLCFMSSWTILYAFAPWFLFLGILNEEERGDKRWYITAFDTIHSHF